MKSKIISTVLVFVLMLSFVNPYAPFVASAVEAICENYEVNNSLENSEKCVEFIEENFAKVVSEYNLAHSEDGVLCTATSIEGRARVYITDLGRYGIYLDFDGNNGYLLVTENYHLYEFEPIGDLPYLKNVDFAYYSSFDGFLYKDDTTGILERYEHVDNSNEFYGCYNQMGAVSDHEGLISAVGQDSEGYIYDIDSYVADVYPEYEYVGRYISMNYQWIYQQDTSIFYQTTDFGQYTEGNCVINATYSMMNDWYTRKSRFSWLPYGTIDYSNSCTSDPLYGTYGTGVFQGWSVRSHTELINMPVLYMELRSYAIEYGYLPDQGMQSPYIIDMVERVGSVRGHTLNMLSSSSFNEDVIYSLDTDQTCILVVSGSDIYGNHAMGLYGYVEYEYTTGWWIFSKTKTKYFYVVDDGYSYKDGDSRYTYKFVGVNTPVCYFDPNTSDDPSILFYYLEN